MTIWHDFQFSPSLVPEDLWPALAMLLIGLAAFVYVFRFWLRRGR